MSFCHEKEAKGLFQELPFYNVPVEKLRIRHLRNIDLLHERPFSHELSINQISKAFKGYTRS